MRTIAALLTWLALASAALAQTVNGPVPNAGAYGAYNLTPPTCINGRGCWFQTDVNGNLKVSATGGGAGGATTVTAAPRSSMSTAGCTVGVASAQCAAANVANTWVQLQNTSDTASIACRWGSPAILNDANSFMLAPGQSASWGVISSGVPTNALNCIATAAATPLYIEFR